MNDFQPKKPVVVKQIHCGRCQRLTGPVDERRPEPVGKRFAIRYRNPKSVATAVEESHHHLPLMSGLWNEAGGERRQRATGKAKIAEKPMSRTVAKVAVA